MAKTKRFLIRNKWFFPMLFITLFLLMPVVSAEHSVNLVNDSKIIIKIDCNLKHDLMINGNCGEYILAADLKVGDEFLTPDGKIAKITSIKDSPIFKKLSNENPKPIGDIKGDYVLSYDSKLKANVPAKVSNIFTFWRNDYYIIKTDFSNVEIKVTPEHPFYVVSSLSSVVGGQLQTNYDKQQTDGSWVLVKDLKVGDELLTDTGEKTKIVSIEKIHTDNPFAVYNLEVDGSHTYYANGVLVHNKDVGLCVSGDTKVLMGNKSFKSIKDIKYGDVVLTWNFNSNSLEKSTVHEITEHFSDDIYLINGKIKVTSGHPFWTEESGWSAINDSEVKEHPELKLSKLKVGMHFMDYNKNYIPITSIIKINETIEVYNLADLENNHDYFADGVLVHNAGNPCEMTPNGRVPLIDPKEAITFDKDDTTLHWAMWGATQRGRLGREVINNNVKVVSTKEVISDVRNFANQAFKPAEGRPDWVIMYLEEGSSNQYTYDLASPAIIGPSGEGAPKYYLNLDSRNLEANFRAIINKNGIVRDFYIFDEGSYTGKQLADRLLKIVRAYKDMRVSVNKVNNPLKIRVITSRITDQAREAINGILNNPCYKDIAKIEIYGNRMETVGDVLRREMPYDTPSQPALESLLRDINNPGTNIGLHQSLTIFDFKLGNFQSFPKDLAPFVENKPAPTQEIYRDPTTDFFKRWKVRIDSNGITGFK